MANELRGLDGNDQLVGHGGNDWLDGGYGDDVMSGGAGIQAEHLPERVRDSTPPRVLEPAGDGIDMREHIAEIERAAIVEALEATGGNQTHAAERLGVSRRALIHKLEKYGLKPPPISKRR